MLIRPLHCLPLLLVSMALQAGFAQKVCSNADLFGLYGFSASGRIFQPANTPITGPFARAGYATIDGAGKLLITSTASYNGLIFAEVFDGTYQVKPDCTFTYIANLGEPINFPVQFNGVIYEGGKRADFMLANPPGTTINATIVRQNRNCSNADMAGSFAFYSSGTVIAPADSAGPVVRIGRLTAVINSSIFAVARNEPEGFLSLSSTVSYGGAVRQENHTGRYKVNANCSMAMQLSADGGVTSVAYDGIFVNGANQAIFVQNAPGTAVTGTITRQ